MIRPAPRSIRWSFVSVRCGFITEARKEDPELSLNAAVVRIGQRIGVNPDTLRCWCERAAIDAGERPGTTTSRHSASKRWRRRCASGPA